MASKFLDPIAAKLVAVLEAQGPSILVGRYYSGDPLEVPKSLLPACFISKDRTTISDASNAEDQTLIPYTLNVAIDLAAKFGQGRITAYDALVDAIEPRDSAYKLRSGGIVYALRKNESLDSNLWINATDDLQIDYGFGPPEKRGFWTVEAAIRISITHHQIRPGLEG